jgi:hypothetical protein
LKYRDNSQRFALGCENAKEIATRFPFLPSFSGLKIELLG